MENSPHTIREILNKKTGVTWSEFGIIWEWAQEQEWWRKFGGSVYEDTYDSDPKYKMPICELEYFINPDKFADAVYEFLNSKEGKRR